MRRRTAWLGSGILLVVIVGLAAAPYVRSAAFVLDLAGSSGAARRLLPVRTAAVRTHDIQVPTRYGDVPARIAEPVEPTRKTVVVFPGIHAGGVEEPRLAAFSTRLAASGVRVVTMPLPDLRAFRITTRSTDMIEDAAAYVAADRALAPTGQVGLAGVSFAGGLALVAAGRPSLAGKIHFVISIGGHSDLPRVLTYLCTGTLADGGVRQPHDYGVAVLLLAAVDRLVPADETMRLRQAITEFLVASSDAEFAPERAGAEFAEAARMGAALHEPARTLMQWVSERNTAALGRVLLPHVDALGGDAALSPERSAPATAPVFLLHGNADNIIPSSETAALAAYLERGRTRVTWLLTPLLTHAHVQDGTAGESWRLVRFWKALLDAAE